ncbi:hypothetical protein [Paractinoplanes maris]|uniref:hypothetical protein n=1 Tax=Paractinoplanes maris TaxID=1734446 RepID=UPI0020229646|nr:hypothetical protein [Actinoplanes maris]
MNADDKAYRRADASFRSNTTHSSRSPAVADLVFVVITVALFAALTVLIKAVERW